MTTNEPLLKRPSLKSVLKLAAKIGVSSGKILLFVLFVFMLVNIGLVVYGLVRLLSSDFSWTNTGAFAAVLLLAICFTILASYMTYRYILLMIIKKVYDSTLEQRTKITEDIIHRIEGVFDGDKEPSQAQLYQAVGWSKTVHRYYQAVPVFFQSGITQYLMRIPVTNYIINLKEDILAGDQSTAAAKLRTSIDEFFENRIIGSPSNIWTWVLLVVNILVQYGLISWGMIAR